MRVPHEVCRVYHGADCVADGVHPAEDSDGRRNFPGALFYCYSIRTTTAVCVFSRQGMGGGEDDDEEDDDEEDEECMVMFRSPSHNDQSRRTAVHDPNNSQFVRVGLALCARFSLPRRAPSQDAWFPVLFLFSLAYGSALATDTHLSCRVLFRAQHQPRRGRPRPPHNSASPRGFPLSLSLLCVRAYARPTHNTSPPSYVPQTTTVTFNSNDATINTCQQESTHLMAFLILSDSTTAASARRPKSPGL